VSKQLVIVESPAKARTIGKFLGRNYTVKASMGHVRDLPKSGLGVDVEDGFRTEWEPIKDRAKVLKDLRERVISADTIYLATDPDREGEAIAWHLVESLLSEEEKAEKTIQRVVFHEITDAAIKEAFEHPLELNTPGVDAYRTRRVLDRLMGYQLSPLLWKKMARGLSAGRVQSVAVRLVVEREREIREFNPEEYWRLIAHFGEEGSEEVFEAEFGRLDGEKLKLTDAATTMNVLSRVSPGSASLTPVDNEASDKDVLRYPPVIDAAPFTITKLEQKARQDRARPPFITSTLQQAAAGRYGFTARRTMRVAQQLYEGMELPGKGAVGLITYMRTDSFNISKSAQQAALELIPKLYGPKYVPDKPNAYRSKKGAQEAHEAVRPTDPTLRPEDLGTVLSAEQMKLYELIWRRFMSSQMSPAEYLVTNVELTCNGAAFDAAGRVTTFDGHTCVYGRDSRDDQQLPALAEGQEMTSRSVDATQHFTSPPRRFTEASLVRSLEKHGIGRPSTYASILSTIVDRKYVDHGEEATEDEARRAMIAGEDEPVVQEAPAADSATGGSGEGDDDEAPADDRGPQRKRSKSFHATHLGEAVTDLLIPYFDNIVNTEFTANMESELDRVAEGAVGWEQVVQDFYDRFSSDLKNAEENMQPYWERPMLLTDMQCGKVPEDGGPACTAPMAVLFNRFGSYLGCSRYPDCKNTLSLTGRKKAEAELTDHTCRKRNDKGVVCGRQMERKVNRWGSAFLACTGFKEKKCDGTVSVGKAGDPLWPVETSVPCPDCETPLVVKRSRRGKFLACTRFPKCRGTLSLPACTRKSRTGKACGKPMTEPVAGGKMACKVHPDVKLVPPIKKKKDEEEESGGKAAPAPNKAARKKATKKKAASKKATSKKKTSPSA
jgi:DNA topoisomerase-1